MKAARRKRRRGRPTKYSPEIGGHICAAIQRGCTQEVAALSAGIGERTLYDWLRKFPHFSQCLTRARPALLSECGADFVSFEVRDISSCEKPQTS